jgi:hypothetical protein
MLSFLASSWPVILPSVFVGFICGACWMHRRCRYMFNRRTVLFESINGAVDKALKDDGEMIPARGSRQEGRLAGH